MSDPIASVRTAVAGRYEIEREIGQGAFATVYLARDLRHERRVAFKILNADPDSEMSELRFLREIRYLARLQHPNILPLIDSGHAGAMLWYVMPYVSGESLRARMQRERQLPIADAVGIAQTIADALEHAHRNGLVHRDIKPENILLSAGHPVVADFGIARAIDTAGVRQLTRTGSGSPGTPAYMSPEQLLSDGTPIDGRADTYSLGCVLYEMLTGKPPFPGKDGFVKRFTEPPPLPSLLRRDLPEGLDAVVSTAMARAPGERFQTAGALCEALAALDVGRSRSSGGGLRASPAVGSPAPISPVIPALELPQAVSAPSPAPAVADPAPAFRFGRPGRRSLLAGGALLALIVVSAVAAKYGRNHLTAGLSALDAGHVRDAIEEFRAASAADTGSARASLWLAQSLFLAGEDTTPEWRRAAARAAAGSSNLVVGEAARAQGLAAMAKEQYDKACTSFGTVDSSLRSSTTRKDPAVTFSLAECQARDSRVVQDSTSPSGWRFRGDRDAGIKLYQALLEQLPPGHEMRRTIYAHLPKFLILEWGRYRAGRGWPDSSLRFGAFPSLVKSDSGDKVMYEPHSLTDFRAGQAWMNPPTMERAWERDRTVLHAIAHAAVADDPKSADAHRLLALALELGGEIVPTHIGMPSALEEIRTARRLSDASTDLPFRVTTVRLLVKIGAFGDARALSDSTLSLYTHYDRESIDDLASLAALTGRAKNLVELLTSDVVHDVIRMPDGHPFVPNSVLAASSVTFAAYAVLGGPHDSLVALRDRVDRQIRSYSSARARDSVRTSLLGRWLSLSLPSLGPTAVVGLLGSSPLLRAQQSLAHADTAAVRAALASLREHRSNHATAALSLDQVYQEAWLRAAIKDSTEAAAQIDDALNGLPALGTGFLSALSEAGSLGPLMMLRAGLAAQSGDPITARHWRDSALSLRADLAGSPLR